MLGGSEKGTGGGNNGPLPSFPPLFNEEEAEKALAAVEIEIEEEKLAGAYTGPSLEEGQFDDPLFDRSKTKGGKKAKKAPQRKARGGGGGGGGGGAMEHDGDEGGEDVLLEDDLGGAPLTQAQIKAAQRAAQRAAQFKRREEEAQKELDNMTDEEYREHYNSVSLEDDSDREKQNHKNYSLLQTEFLLLSIERVSSLRPHSMLTGASSDDEVRNAWKPVAELFNLLVNGEWDVQYGEQPYFEDFYGVGRYTPTAVQGVKGVQRTHSALYAKWQTTAPKAPPINTGNPVRNPPRHNRQFAIWKEWARVKGECV